MKTPAPGFLGARALVDEEEVPGRQGGDGTPDCERPLSREINASRPTERLRQPGEHHKVGMKRLGVLVALPPKRGSNLLCCAARKRGTDRSGLSAPLSAAATSLIGGGKLSFFALRLFPLAVLAPAPDRLGAASHRDEPNNQLDDLHAATQFFEPDWIARCSTAPSLKCQSPLTLRSSGFDRTTISRLPDRCQH